MEEFEVTGSTYEPIGEVFQRGQRVKCSDFEAMFELATICVMCNDSSIDFNEYKQQFEKVGEATETALVVLAEKMNPWEFEKRGLSRRDAALVVNHNVKRMWNKEYTLEFSRDRKSMSSYCIPKANTKLGNDPKMFVKVRIVNQSMIAVNFTKIKSIRVHPKVYWIVVHMFESVIVKYR